MKSGGAVSAIRCSAAAQLPRSMSLQRSEQNGRLAFFAVHFTAFLQLGHLTIRAVVMLLKTPRVGQQPDDAGVRDLGHCLWCEWPWRDGLHASIERRQ